MSAVIGSAAIALADLSGNSYESVATSLLDFFQNQSFKDKVAARQALLHSVCVFRIPNGSRIVLRFPGEKSGMHTNKLQHYAYDFRVELQRGRSRYVISHAELCLELFCKCEAGSVAPGTMRALITDLAVSATIPPNLPPAHVAIRAETLSKFVRLHESKGKTPGSLLATVRLSTEELLETIFWILLQEEFNYPLLPYGGSFSFHGRRMAVARYLEAIAAAEGRCSIEDVILRALVEGSCPKSLQGVDYSPIEEIGPVLIHERKRLELQQLR